MRWILVGGNKIKNVYEKNMVLNGQAGEQWINGWTLSNHTQEQCVILAVLVKITVLVFVATVAMFHSSKGV